MTGASTKADPLTQAAKHRRSVAMVFLCTVLGAAAQMCFKAGLRHMPHFSVGAVLLNWPLLLGLLLYGGSTLLLILALREGQLSLLYPVISLTYAWVTMLSVLWLGETMNPFKLAGVTVIIIGVGLLGRGSSS